MTRTRKRFAVMLWHERGRFSTVLGFVIAENAPHATSKGFKKWPQHMGSMFARHAWGKAETDPNHYTRAINYRADWRAR